MRVVICPDKFKGTATANEVIKAVDSSHAVHTAEVIKCPLADGGEGTLEALGGANRSSEVAGPLGRPVAAAWRYAAKTAVIEMSRASGLLLVGGKSGNDPLLANTRGTGELISAAREAGARRIIVGVGGSASTDGGYEALRAMQSIAKFRGIEIQVACDVTTKFLDAPRVFGPQKGATALQVDLLTRRLEMLADLYLEQYGIEVRPMARSGAAGGLAGGLAAFGAQLVDGFGLIADEVELAELIEGADLVITGEGRLDQTSFDGKVVGGVYRIAQDLKVPVLAIVGEVEEETSIPDSLNIVSLVELFGYEKATKKTLWCISEATNQFLSG